MCMLAAPAQPGCQVQVKDVGINETHTLGVAESEDFIVHDQVDFIPNPDRWVNRVKISSLDPRVRAKAMCT